MKKKILATAATLALTIPAFAFAAFNDVSLTTGADVSVLVGGTTVTLNVTTGTVETLTVTSSDFTFGLTSGSTVTISSPNRYEIGVDNNGLVTSDACNGSASNVTLTSTSASTESVKVTPTDNVCAASTGSNDGGGGGGGGSTPAPAPAPTPAPTPTPATPGAQGHLTALVAQLQSLIKLYISLGGTATPEMLAFAGPSAPAPGTFARDLTSGSTGNDVKVLQVWLNANGFQVAASGPGSPGNETTMFGGLTRAAVAKFQAAKGISPAAGYFGPKTRAVVNAL